jgi:hypothetical protein
VIIVVSVRTMNRQQMLKEVNRLEEFNNFNTNNFSTTELGAILGLWDIGDGNVRNK